MSSSVLGLAWEGCCPEVTDLLLCLPSQGSRDLILPLGGRVVDMLWTELLVLETGRGSIPVPAPSARCTHASSCGFWLAVSFPSLSCHSVDPGATLGTWGIQGHLPSPDPQLHHICKGLCHERSFFRGSGDVCGHVWKPAACHSWFGSTSSWARGGQPWRRPPEVCICCPPSRPCSPLGLHFNLNLRCPLPSLNPPATSACPTKFDIGLRWHGVFVSRPGIWAPAPGALVWSSGSWLC